MAAGGQAGTSSKIENYPGFPSGISGGELTNRIFLQANRFGSGFTAASPVIAMRREQPADHEVWMLELEGGEKLRAHCVLIATGAEYRRLDAECRERFEGAGIYYSAPTVDPQLYENSTVVVVGGGNSAGQAIMYLAPRAQKVLVVIRGDDLNKSMSSYLVRRIEEMLNVEVLKNTRVRRCEGVTSLAAVQLEDLKSNTTRVIETPALFSFIGALPRTVDSRFLFLHFSRGYAPLYHTGLDSCFFARILPLSNKSTCASLQSPLTSHFGCFRPPVTHTKQPGTRFVD
jgi:thioredoxin reductase (NADPH)